MDNNGGNLFVLLLFVLGMVSAAILAGALYP